MLAALILWIGGGTTDGYDTAGHYNSRNILRRTSDAQGALLEEAAPEGQVDAAPILWVLARPPGRAAAVDHTPRNQAPLSSVDARIDDVAQAIICAEGTPWPCEWARAVVGCESSFQTDAWATEVIDGVRHYFHGWFQHISESPDPGPLADPVYNTALAAAKFRTGGAGHWPACG